MPEEKKMEFRAKYNDTCAKCNGPITGWLSNGWTSPADRVKADEITWARTGSGTKGMVWHVGCANLPIHPEYKGPNPEKGFTGEIPTESKESKPAIPTESKPAAAPVPPAPSGGLEGMLAAALLPHIEGKIRATEVNLSAEIDAKIQAAVQNASKVITVENKRTGERKEVGRQHENFPKLLTLIASGHNVYMQGAPGSGKSTAAQKAAESLSLRYGYISLSAQTAESRILGFMNANGQYVETEFFRCYKDGGVFCIDEMDNASANLLTALNSALENGRAAFPHEVVEQHKDFVLVATGNTAGYGANPMFPERRPMDAAFRERFVFLNWEYDESLERDLALSVNDKAGKWIDWVQKVRKYAATNFPKLLVTPRASIKGAGLVKDFKPEEVANMVIFKGFDKDSVGRIMSANPLPRGM